jgi:glycosyltransferase involved in cell wall biosynthesis
MNICLVVAGGVDQSARERSIPVLLALIELLSARHSVRVIALYQQEKPCRYELLGAEVVCLGRLQRPLRRLERWWHWQQARGLLSDGPPDVIHAFGLGPPATLARWLSKQQIPLVASLWGGEVVALPQIGYGGWLRPSSRLEAALNLRSAKALTAGSEFARRMIARWRPDARMVPLGPDARLFNVLPRQAGPPWRLLHVGDINWVKHQRVLLEALKQLEGHLDYTLDWVGVDTLSGRMQALAKALGIEGRIRFYGHQPWEQVVQLHQQAHLLLQSSLYESQGVAVMEAALAGVPTVGSGVGLVSDLDPQAARAVVPDDPQALAQGILDLIRDPKRLLQMGQAARAWAQGHDAAWTARAFEQIYAEVC